MRNIVKQGSTYYVAITVPPDVGHLFPTKSIWRTTGTGDPREAGRIGAAIRVRIKKEIADARASLRHAASAPDRSMEAIIALEAWAAQQTRMAPEHYGEASPAPFTIAAADALQRVVDDPEQYREVEGFDAYVARCLTVHGCAVAVDDAVIAAIRQQAALTFLYALKFHEKARQADLFLRKAKAVAADGVEAFPIVPVAPDKGTPAPALTISKLQDQWMEAIKPSEKDRQRLDHQFRRLKECVGDKPANYLTKADVSEFMGLVARFPGRKRSAELNALPMRELVEQFEANNAKAKAEGEPNVETLTKTSAENWFAAFKRCWAYAVLLDLVEKNPWEGLKPVVVNGAKSVKRRAFTDDEVKHIFTQPNFQTPERRDAKWWLPILSLFHGGRLAEFAAMPLTDVRQTANGIWYFAVTPTDNRGLKTEHSQRQIPLHPHMLTLGFAEHIAGLRAAGHAWLFPELDHETRHGPGHAFSKWWGAYMDRIKLTDPSITHHSWRHTWKRYARASEVKEELHDIISGHKGPNSVSRRYGEGAPVEDLAREMAKIQFASFPPLSGRA